MLSNIQIAEAKGLLAAGHKQHDIAAHYGVNGGRIADIASGKLGGDIRPASAAALPSIKPVRFFAPDQPLNQQVEILEDLIENHPKDVARVRVITPALAAHILNNLNPVNRRVSTTKVQKYAAAMKAKRWPITGATVVFSSTGVLLDGQHRLRACVQANKPLKTFIVFGVDHGDHTLLDIGRKRTGGDAFTMAGVKNAGHVAAATRWLKIFETDPTDRSLTVENDELFDYYGGSLDGALLDEVVDLAEAVSRSSRSWGPMRRNYLPVGSLAAILYLAAKVNRQKALAFAHALGRKRLSVCRSIINRMDNNGGRLHEVVRNALLVKAWRAFSTGTRPTAAQLAWALGDDFPSFR